MNNMTVANTILAQLGGNKFLNMTGAKDLAGSEVGLSFRLPGGAGFSKNGINRVDIVLEGDDTYTVNFVRQRAVTMVQVALERNVYAGDLRKVFESHTGLRTNL